MGKLIFIRFVLIALLLHTTLTDITINVPNGGTIRLPIGNLTEGYYSICVKRTDMNETYYVYFESDGHIDDTYQHPAYKKRTSRENNHIIIENASTTDNGPYTIAVIPDEVSDKNRLKTPPTIYEVLVTAEKNLWLTVGLLLGGSFVVLVAVALGIFFYKPLSRRDQS